MNKNTKRHTHTSTHLRTLTRTDTDLPPLLSTHTHTTSLALLLYLPLSLFSLFLFLFSLSLSLSFLLSCSFALLLWNSKDNSKLIITYHNWVQGGCSAPNTFDKRCKANFMSTSELIWILNTNMIKNYQTWSENIIKTRKLRTVQNTSVNHIPHIHTHPHPCCVLDAVGSSWTPSSSGAGRRDRNWARRGSNRNLFATVIILVPNIASVRAVTLETTQKDFVPFACERKACEEDPGLCGLSRPRHIPTCWHQSCSGRTCRKQSCGQWSLVQSAPCAHRSDLPCGPECMGFGLSPACEMFASCRKEVQASCHLKWSGPVPALEMEMFEISSCVWVCIEKLKKKKKKKTWKVTEIGISLPTNEEHWNNKWQHE